MTSILKPEIVRLNREHPEWCDIEIAAELHCNPDFVRGAAQSLNIRLGTRRGRPIVHGEYNSLAALGRAARDAGMTLEALRAIAAAKQPPVPAAKPTGSPPRLAREHWDAVDAALERAGILPDRTGRDA